MRLAVALLLLAVPARADRPRALEVAESAGLAWRGPTERWKLSTDALDPMTRSTRVGLSFAWERDPFSFRGYDTYTWRWVYGAFTWAPEADLVIDGAHVVAQAGLRLERLSPWTPWKPRAAPILREWVALHAGVRDGARVAGVDYVNQIQITRTYGVTYAVGADFWAGTMQLSASLGFTVR